MLRAAQKDVTAFETKRALRENTNPSCLSFKFQSQYIVLILKSSWVSFYETKYLVFQQNVPDVSFNFLIYQNQLWDSNFDNTNFEHHKSNSSFVTMRSPCVPCFSIHVSLIFDEEEKILYENFYRLGATLSKMPHSKHCPLSG